jgi:hypothetical protein
MFEDEGERMGDAALWNETTSREACGNPDVPLPIKTTESAE